MWWNGDGEEVVIDDLDELLMKFSNFEKILEKLKYLLNEIGEDKLMKLLIEFIEGKSQSS